MKKTIKELATTRYTKLCFDIIKQSNEQLKNDKPINASLLKTSFDIMNTIHNLKYKEIIEEDPDQVIDFIEDETALD